MPPASSANICWVLHDGAAGNRRQALALALALGMETREWNLRANAPARWFAPRIAPYARFQYAYALALQETPP